MKKPKAALFYYDSFDLLTGLSDEQLGILFRAVMEYGKSRLRGEAIPIQVFRRNYPDMTEGTYGFFAFMADSIRRDTDTYLQKCANYSAAAQRREAEKARSGRAPSSVPVRSASRNLAEDSAWNYVT